MKILCSKYLFDSDTELNDVNFTSPACTAINPSLVRTIDLQDFLIKRGKTTYKFDFLNERGELCSESGSKNITVSNISQIAPQQFLSDFFEVYNFTESGGYYLWLIDFYDASDNWIYRGVIERASVQMKNRVEEEIDIIVTGMDKQFKEYFSNVKLQTFSYLNLPMLNQTFPGSQYTELDHILNLHLGLLEHPARFYNIAAHGNLGYCYIIMKPWLYCPATHFGMTASGDTFFCKNGYENFYYEGLNFFDFFDSLCLARGWVWFFHKNELVIKNRAEVYSNKKIIPVSRFMNHSVGCKTFDIQVDNILIDDGNFDCKHGKHAEGAILYSRDDLFFGGERAAAFSGNNYFNNNINPFSRISLANNNDPIYQLNFSGGYETNFRGADTPENYAWLAFGLQPDYYASVDDYGFNAVRTLFLHPAVNSSVRGKCDLLHPRTNDSGFWKGNNFYWVYSDLGNGDLGYHGNVANCLFRKIPSGNSYFLETYQDWIKSEQFKSNFKRFLRYKNQVVFDIDLPELITDPRFTVQLSAYNSVYPSEYAYDNMEATVQELEYDELTETSKIKIQF